MSRRVDLNSDMGEGFGRWKMGDDAALLDVVTSANIACGFHGGDPDQMAKCMALAVKNGVGIGAHPGFYDLQGFGRRRMDVPHDTVANWCRYQLGAAQAIARAAGGTVRHFKLHGALSNMASTNPDMARACFRAALDIDPDIIHGLAWPHIRMMRGRGTRSWLETWAGEIFADRAYPRGANAGRPPISMCAVIFDESGTGLPGSESGRIWCARA